MEWDGKEMMNGTLCDEWDGMLAWDLNFGIGIVTL
jgi:hypothetical protein